MMTFQGLHALESHVSSFINLDRARALHEASDVPKDRVFVGVHDISFFGYKVLLKGLVDERVQSSSLSLMSAHGTSVAQIIAHPEWGVNEQVRFLSLTKGIDYESFVASIENLRKHRVKLLNVSMTLKDPRIIDLLNSFIDDGGVVIVSAGNNGARRGRAFLPHYAHLKAMIVAASDLEGNLEKFSQYEEGKTILAPGSQNLLRTNYLRYPIRVREEPKELSEGFSLTHHHFGMTSGATPIVTGVVSMALELNPKLRQKDINELLFQSAQSNDLGQPIIDAHRFIELTLKTLE